MIDENEMRVVITGEVPEEYWENIPAVDMQKIQEALERGEKLDFAHLEPWKVFIEELEEARKNR